MYGEFQLFSCLKIKIMSYSQWKLKMCLFLLAIMTNVLQKHMPHQKVKMWQFLLAIIVSVLQTYMPHKKVNYNAKIMQPPRNEGVFYLTWLITQFWYYWNGEVGKIISCANIRTQVEISGIIYNIRCDSKYLFSPKNLFCRVGARRVLEINSCHP